MLQFFFFVWSTSSEIRLMAYFICWFQSQTMKEEHSQLSLKAHECADLVPELNKMVSAVQSLGKFASTPKLCV